MVDPNRSVSVRGEKPWPSLGTPGVRPWGESVAVYGEFRVAAVTGQPLRPERHCPTEPACTNQLRLNRLSPQTPLAAQITAIPRQQFLEWPLPTLLLTHDPDRAQKLQRQPQAGG